MGVTMGFSIRSGLSLDSATRFVGVRAQTPNGLDSYLVHHLLTVQPLPSYLTSLHLSPAIKREFAHSFHKYSSSTYPGPPTDLEARELPGNKTNKSPCPQEADILIGRVRR